MHAARSAWLRLPRPAWWLTVLVRVLLMALGILSMAPGVRAVTTWTGNTSTDWNTASNWSPASVPTSSSNVSIDSNGTIQPILSSGNVSVLALHVGDTASSGSNTSLTVTNGAIMNVTYSGPAGPVGDGASIGYGGQGSLFITDGGKVVNNGAGGVTRAILGYNPGSVGTVLITGTGSTWSLNGAVPSLLIGLDGTGNLTVANGGQIIGNVSSVYQTTIGFFSGSDGSLTITGAGSSYNIPNGLLLVGNSGQGNLTVSNGGSFTANTLSTFVVAGATGVNGTIIVDGSGSVFTTTGSNMVLGSHGNGTMTISNAAVAILPSVSFDSGGAGGSGTLNLDSGGILQIGGTNALVPGGTYSFNFGGGILQSDSDLTTAVNATLASATTSTVDTHGFNATWSGNLSGAGALQKSGLGTLTLSGNDTYAGGTSVENGTLAITNIGSSSVLGTGDVLVSLNGTLAGNGTVTGNATIAGALAPGGATSTGLMTFSQNLTLDSGATLALELNGTVRSTLYDAFDVAENLALGGTLEVLLGSGYTPAVGDSFQLFTDGGATSGSFADVELPTLAPKMGWDTTQLNNGLIVVVPEPASMALAVALMAQGWALFRKRRAASR